MPLSSSGSPVVLLAHSYYLTHDAKQWERMKPYPPLATLIVASVLRQHGFDVHLFDATLASGVAEFDETVGRVSPSVVVIVEDNFNFVTKMCTLRMREAGLHMVRVARAAGAKVIVNGADPTDRPDLYIGAGAHAVVLGDPEPGVLDLLRSWCDTASRDAREIAGLVVPEPGNGGRVHRTPTRPPLSTLDQLPFPAWDLVDADTYRRAWTRAHGRLSWNMVTSRGCPYRCNWCAKPLFGTRYSQRTPENVAAELLELRETIRPDHVWFADDIFGLTPPWIESFAQEVRRRDARTAFMMQSRVNLMTPRVVAALAEAGAEEVWLGVESGSQRILKAMDKGSTIAQIRAATRELRRCSIRCGWFIQLGYRGEDWADILMTRDLIRAEQPDEVGVSVSYPLPGTRFYEQVRIELGSKTNWEDSDDLAMMFQGTYTTTFYKRVRDLLHLEVSTRTHRDDDWEELRRAQQECRVRTPA